MIPPDDPSKFDIIARAYYEEKKQGRQPLPLLPIARKLGLSDQECATRRQKVQRGMDRTLSRPDSDMLMAKLHGRPRSFTYLDDLP